MSVVEVETSTRAILSLQTVFEIQDEVRLLKEQIKQLEREVEIQESRAKEAIISHMQIGHLQDGPFIIKQAAKPKMAIDTDLFAEKYPEEFDILFRKEASRKFKPSKKDAEFVLTSYQIEQICKPLGDYKYEVDYDIRAGVEL